MTVPIEATTAMIRRVAHVVRGALPAVVTATVVPLALFYGVSAGAGMKAGIIASLAWAYLMLGRQLLASRRLSGLLMVTAFALTARCAAWAIHQSTFTYFFVPVVETVGMAGIFLVTLALGRPLLVSLARDFLPSLGDQLNHRSYRPMVRRLSWLWGAVNLGSAATSATLLTTQNLHLFLLFHSVSGWIWTGTGITVSFLYGRRHASDLFAFATNIRSSDAASPTLAPHPG